MLRNYLTIAIRNLLKNKTYSFINIAGLGIGMAACLLILLWVSDELSYDRWNEKADRIFRTDIEAQFGGNHIVAAVSPSPLSRTLLADFPEVEASVRLWNNGSALVKSKDQNFKEEGVIFADSTLFQVFSIELLKGNPDKVLAPPDAVIISESAAKKYFQDEDPIGKALIFDNEERMFVSGIFRDIPANSHFQFDFFRSLHGRNDANNNGNWLSHNYHTYFVLRKGVDPKAFEKKMYDHLLKSYIGPQAQQLLGQPIETLRKAGTYVNYYLMPLTSIHLTSNKTVELGPNGNIQYVWIFGLAALFVLLIAVVNFMNLSTARSALRAKEIGIRKVVGSYRSALIRQFLSESVLLSFLALVLALVLSLLFLPAYNTLAGKQLSIPFGNPVFLGAVFAGTLVTGLLAGVYPAFFLSGFQPVNVLKGRFFETLKGQQLRSGLVVFQFLIAIALIFCSIVIRQQLFFIQTKELGFNREQVLVVNDGYALGSNLEAFEEAVKGIPAVRSVSASGYLPVPSNRSDSPICSIPEVRQDACVSSQLWVVDYDYIPTLGMKLVKGRNFSREMPTDSSAVILNETAAKGLFGNEDPIGKKAYSQGSFDDQGNFVNVSYEVIGVVKDFNYESLRQNINSLTFFLGSSTSNISMKVQGEDYSSTIAAVERIWKQMAPGSPFSYQFLDERFNEMYRAETRVGRLFNIFSLLSILVACLGLLGLAAFTAERRTKEIGIRKVMGASGWNIVLLLSKDIMKLVVIALVLAAPLAWWGMNLWLKNFAYRIQIEWWAFVVAGALALIIAFLTVSFQSLRAALMDPVKSLRAE